MAWKNAFLLWMKEVKGNNCYQTGILFESLIKFSCIGENA